MEELRLTVSIVPDGLGHDLFAAACDDPKLPNFRSASEAARHVFDCSENEINTEKGSLDKRKIKFSSHRYHQYPESYYKKS